MFHEIVPKDNLVVLAGEYSVPLVVLSIVIIWIASYTALAMNERVKNNSFFHKNFWFILASLAMGAGIWSMHYVGMFAFALPVEIRYDIPLTILSIFPAFLASFLAFYLVNRKNLSISLMIVTSVIMGSGVSAMHYIGMASMISEARHVYDFQLFSISIIISFLAFFLFAILNRYMYLIWFRVIASIGMGLVIASMHYVGMYAVSFYVRADYQVADDFVILKNVDVLVISVIIGLAILLGSLILSYLGDKYVEYRAKNYDNLTMLPNHRLFEENLRKVPYMQIAVWEIRDFEDFNRVYGYQFGDVLLTKIVALFQKHMPPATELYRIEQNRFAFITKKSKRERPIFYEMQDIAALMDYPIEIQNENIVISALCAIANVIDDKNAWDMYMDALAVINYPNIQFSREVVEYNPNIHKASFERDIVDDIAEAMHNHDLFIVYQPKVNGKTMEIAGLESLIRWNHPTYGFLNPGVFISILERNDRMIIVTDWIIENVCKQIAQWKDANIYFGKVSVNIPGYYVTSQHLLDMLTSTVEKYHVQPDELELEITETSFVKNMETAMRAVSLFREKGFPVALDDFGTGVSSLSYLKQMTISTMKIDKTFVSDVPMSPRDSSIIQAIISLGESLGLEIVIEGVETKEQAQFFAEICHKPIIQGFYFAKPMQPNELLEWKTQFISHD